MEKLWSEKIPFPRAEDMRSINGIEYSLVHTAEEDGYQFLIGAAVAVHKGVIYCSFANSLRTENDNTTVLAEKRSYDGGKTWSDWKRISKDDDGYCRSHGVYLSLNGELYVFCPRAKFDRNLYPDINMECYKLNSCGGYDYLGIVLADELWPMCEPIVLSDGSLVMAGLRTKVTDDIFYGRAAVAVCDGKDITKWEMVTLPFAKELESWGETAVVKSGECLTAFVRSPEKLCGALVSRSLDGGKTWLPLADSNFPISDSKLGAGELSNGLKYLIFNVKGRDRDTLAIAFGRDTFERVYIIRDGFTAEPKFYFHKEWAYPYACEDKENGRLLVAYHLNKEDCELAIIPTEALEL